MRLWIIVGVVVVVIGGLAWYSGMQSAVPVEAAKAVAGPIREFVDEQGVTRLPMTYLITMPFNGRVEPIALAEGDTVSAGQVVAQVAPADLELMVAEARAAVERLNASIVENEDTSVERTTLVQSQQLVESMESTVQAAAERVKAGEAKLNFANTTLRRTRTLRETNATSQEALDAAQVAQVEAAVDYQQDVLVLSALKSMQVATELLPTVVTQYIARKKLSTDVLDKERAEAEARFQQALRDQQLGQMKSPIDGIVLERLESNEREITAGTVLLKIGQLQKLEAEADVLSQDVVDVKLGDPVELYGPAIGPQPARGKVSQIYPAGFTKVSSLGVEQQRVKVIIAFDDAAEVDRLREQQGLGVGYRVRVRVFTDEKSDALVVPRSALFRGPKGDWQVFAIRGGAARLVTAEVGLMNDDLAEITAGLQAGEAVILAPEANLVDGTRVRAVGID